jgi:hypothetical protein
LQPSLSPQSYYIKLDDRFHLARILAMRYGVIVASVLSLDARGGCTGMNHRQQRALSGGAIGAAGGGAVSALTR